MYSALNALVVVKSLKMSLIPLTFIFLNTTKLHDGGTIKIYLNTDGNYYNGRKLFST